MGAGLDPLHRMAAEVAVECAQAHIAAVKARLSREWIESWHSELLKAEACLEEALRVLNS